MKQAIIKKVTNGKNKGQWRFVLWAANGKVIAVSGTETYHNLQDCKDTCTHNFPDFKITVMPLIKE